MTEKYTKEEFYRRGNVHVHWAEMPYSTDNQGNNKNHFTLRVKLSFHTLRLAIPSINEDTDKAGDVLPLMDRG